MLYLPSPEEHSGTGYQLHSQPITFFLRTKSKPHQHLHNQHLISEPRCTDRMDSYTLTGDWEKRWWICIPFLPCVHPPTMHAPTAKVSGLCTWRHSEIDPPSSICQMGCRAYCRECVPMTGADGAKGLPTYFPWQGTMSPRWGTGTTSKDWGAWQLPHCAVVSLVIHS